MLVYAMLSFGAILLIIALLIEPKALSKFIERPTRAKILGIWLVIIAIIAHLFDLLATPEQKEQLAKMSPPKENYYYSKPDTTKNDWNTYPFNLLNRNKK